MRPVPRGGESAVMAGFFGFFPISAGPDAHSAGGKKQILRGKCQVFA